MDAGAVGLGGDRVRLGAVSGLAGCEHVLRAVMKAIWHTDTLFYYDGPQVFEARDACGGHYVAVGIESGDAQDQYLVAEVSPERLQRFHAGALDLRALLVEGVDGEWYFATAGAGLDQPLRLAAQRTPLALSELLPKPGFTLR